MSVDVLVSLGDMFSRWLYSIYYIFSLEYEQFTAVVFNGATIYNINGVLDKFFTFGIRDFYIPYIPIVSDIAETVFSLLFYDTRFLHMPFYFLLIVCLIRVTVIVWVIDVVKKMIK